MANKKNRTVAVFIICYWKHNNNRKVHLVYRGHQQMTYRRRCRWRQWIATFNTGILVQIKLHKNLLIQHFIHIIH